ncbi:MAG: 16S rRNA (guanine(527)-N(7))-methyltransferase RsmG [Alkalispirochaetaceae bacterium]
MTLSPRELEELRPSLLRGLEALEIPDPGTLAESLLRYTAEVYRFNDLYGLVEADPREFVSHHLLDSLSILAPAVDLQILRRGRGGRGRLIDVGSGAGLPGIPIALALPELSVTLMDRSGKRCGFLRNAAAILRRPDLRVLQGELHRPPAEAVGSHELLLARAFRPLRVEIFRGLAALLSEGGEMLLYKGRRQQVEQELEELLEALPGAELPGVAILDLEVPGLDKERTLLRFRMSA